jgi:cytochrome c-type biogenesis protein CcmH/NrfF
MKTRTPIRPLTVVPTAKTYIPHLLVVLLLWALAMTVDFYDQAVVAEEVQAEAVAQLLGCMNGTQQWIAEDGTEIACMQAVTNKKARK